MRNDTNGDFGVVTDVVEAELRQRRILGLHELLNAVSIHYSAMQRELDEKSVTYFVDFLVRDGLLRENNGQYSLNNAGYD